MQESKIELRIEDIFTFVENCKMQKFSATNVIVPKNDLYDLLDDLERDLPKEIERYQKMLSQRDRILEDAEKKANLILADARAQYSAMIEEHSIMKEAYHQAEETVAAANEEADRIIENARNTAEEIGTGAMYYAADILADAEKLIADAYNNNIEKSRALEVALGNNLNSIRANMAQLVPAQEEQQQPAKSEETLEEEITDTQETPSDEE